MKNNNLRRLLDPQSVAVVGASESLPMARNIILPLLAAGRDVSLVNRRHAKLFGVPTHADLAAIGRPVDAVVSLVNAEMSVDVARQAAMLDCGGIVAIAGGFGESGERGRLLQAKLVAAAGELPLLGPNCAGFMNVASDTWLFTGARLPVQAGGISVVSQSGFFTRAAFAAALERRLGVHLGISSGNEAVCDLADFLEYLVEDEGTRVICLVIEKIRDARRFFAAAQHARSKGKPVIALKLGRTEQGRAISQSHTGALADEAWIYDVALRQAGILVATDIDDMLDQAQLFEQLDATRWKLMRRVGVITASGGVAAHVADLFEDEGVLLSAPAGLGDWVRQQIPGAEVVNPIDMTGFAVGKTEVIDALFDRFADEFDAVVLAWWSGSHDEAWAKMLTEPFARSAQRNPDSVMVLTAAHSGELGEWAVDLRSRHVAVARGPRPLARAIKAMDLHMSARSLIAASDSAENRSVRPAAAPIHTPEGLLLTFDATMAVLQAAGVAVAPYALIDADVKDGARVAALVESLGRAPGGRLVVKLANVAHRTEHGAVEIGVPVGDVPAAVARMRDIARRDGLDSQVVVQAMVQGSGELFVGLQGSSDLGPLLVCGLGGIFVELLKKVSGRLLPMSAAEADAVLNEVAGGTFLAGFRGQAPWNRQALQSLLFGVADIGLRGQDWIASFDLNPVICSADGCTAVDAVCMLKA